MSYIRLLIAMLASKDAGTIGLTWRVQDGTEEISKRSDEMRCI